MSALSLTDARWAAVAGRDARLDGAFVYAVATTGVYCRPSCAARTPNRANVALYATPQDAEAAGFRACRRCRPDGARSAAEARLDHARTWIDARLAADPEARVSLSEMAAAVGWSPGHLQRTFARAVGISPRAYADARRVERARAALHDGESVLTATFEGGFGSGKALYERTEAAFGATPGQVRRGGRGLVVRYALFDTALGVALVAATERGVCAVALGDSGREVEAELVRDWREAEVVRDDAAVGPWAEPVLRVLAGAPDAAAEAAATLAALPADVRGTVFQRRVWDALRQIPVGETRTYGDIAAAVGRPAAARAVAQACAANRLAVVVPCHRVVGADGALRGYRWGPDRKRQLLGIERPETVS